MADNSSPDYKSLFLQAEEGRKQAEERRKQAEDEGRLLRERSRRTTFAEFIHTCHNLLSRPLRVESPSRSTTGTIPLPKGKFCPTRLRPWTECHAQQQTVYNSVWNYLQSTDETDAQLFSPQVALEDLARRFARRPISSEQGLETYERIAVEDHVRDIVDELCKIPAAREEFMLGDGIWFENHTNALEENQAEAAISRRPRPDQFCIHRVDGSTNTLLLTVEYKPPHKLKLQYNAEVLANSAVVQSYDVMIQEGRAYSILTNGLARVLLYVPHDDPTTLYYRLCEPNTEIDEFGQHLRQPQTSIARELCLCLMSFLSPTRDQAWRNFWRSKLHIWETSFDHSHSLIPKAELRQTPPQSRNHNLEYTTPESSSDYQPSSSSIESPTAEGRRVRTRSQAGCTPSSDQRRSQSPDSSGSDSNKATGRKRGFSQVTSSPSAQRAARQRETRFTQGNRPQRRDVQFCTQRCLLGLQTGGILDDSCPNVEIHRQVHAFWKLWAYGAPFKITSTTHGYTVVGKGTTSELWKEVSREAQVCQVLGKAQGSAVPVFLGTIDLAQIYFLHGAGQIRHMLIMGWGGESTATMELTPSLLQEIRRSDKEIEGLGVIHGDLRRENVLWNEELGRALIIDFHRSTLKRLLISKRPRAAKRELRGIESRDGKRLRVG
ncbi:hypothetical protein N7468_010109 [Penicillium chermesinum]|uniref:Protein kinase domain-containing protein n=1 Tax=Penicillium chermesinum TaxID=63820 RepID=A0A9W9TC50_9EURO|nr:uncharacterized protein N7468_010109 [Penicillium chermesinum]KAJ5217101.1 hypothetical protein N7468_010109 [Penicillium chermesinum]